MRSRPLFLTLLLACSCAFADAQTIADVLFGQGTKTNYIGQYNYNGKRKNGFGMERYRDGSFYVGDFSEGEISGRGMLLSNGKQIAHVDGAVVYVGNWRKGAKSGKGTCYDKQGNVVYEGRFANDKPVDAISPQASSAKHFKMEEKGGRLYLGETLGERPEGFGLTIEPDGRVVYGSMKAGKRQGIGMTFFSPEVWEVGQWNDGNYQPFNNSQVATASIQDFRSSNKAFNKSMRGDLLNAAGNFAQAGLNVVAMTHGNSGVDLSNATGHISDGQSQVTVDESETVGSGASSKKLSEDFYRDTYARWTKAAKGAYESLTSAGVKVKEKKTGKDVEGSAAGSWNAGHFSAMKMEMRKAQREMKKTREEARRAGYKIEKSEYETIDVKY